MTEKQLQDLALKEIERQIRADSPPEAIMVETDNEVEWSPDLLRTISSHDLHVLGREPDIIVYFDTEGRVTGWRDDGRRGSEVPAWIERQDFLNAVMSELGLPPQTQLGALEPVELPPLGWMHQAVLFLAPVPTDDQIVRVWVSPENLKVVQCLYGPRSTKRGTR